jgi:hypothetical protein
VCESFNEPIGDSGSALFEGAVGRGVLILGVETACRATTWAYEAPRGSFGYLRA